MTRRSDDSGEGDVNDKVVVIDDADDEMARRRRWMTMMVKAAVVVDKPGRQKRALLT